MPNPKRKMSKTRRDKRRGHHKATPSTLSTCPNCNEVKLAHAACKSCGYYNGRRILEVA